MARAFADKNELRVGIAVGKDDIRSGFVKFAASAVAEIVADFQERIAVNSVDGFE